MTDKPEPPLYQDDQIEIKIDSNPEDHLIGLRKDKTTEYSYFPLARGGLEHFALTRRGKLENSLVSVGSLITHEAYVCGLDADSIHIALLQAYVEDRRRIEIGSAQIAREIEERNRQR